MGWLDNPLGSLGNAVKNLATTTVSMVGTTIKTGVDVAGLGVDALTGNKEAMKNKVGDIAGDARNQIHNVSELTKNPVLIAASFALPGVGQAALAGVGIAANIADGVLPSAGKKGPRADAGSGTQPADPSGTSSFVGNAGSLGNTGGVFGDRTYGDVPSGGPSVSDMGNRYLTDSGAHRNAVAGLVNTRATVPATGMSATAPTINARTTPQIRLV